jgi:hypothetical protein
MKYGNDTYPVSWHLKKLTLGQVYIITYGYKCGPVKFIKVTEKGYNFLDETTNKCVLKRHCYPSKWENHIDKMIFFIRSTVIISEIHKN